MMIPSELNNTKNIEMYFNMTICDKLKYSVLESTKTRTYETLMALIKKVGNLTKIWTQVTS